MNEIQNVEYRKAIAVIEAAMKNVEGSLGEDPFPLTHEFAEGLYIRKILIPAGHFLVGKLHPQSYVSFIESGDMSVLTEHGVSRVTGPCVQISPEGTKRFGYSHEDTVWYTVHSNPTNERDVEKLENIIHADDPFMIPHENLPFNLADIMVLLCNKTVLLKKEG